MKLISRNGRRVCHSCAKLTANAGAVCTRCLSGNRPAQRLPEAPERLGTRPSKSKYTEEQIKVILHTYLTCKMRKLPGPVKAAAKLLDMKGHQVQHVILYYKQKMRQLT